MRLKPRVALVSFVSLPLLIQAGCERRPTPTTKPAAAATGAAATQPAPSELASVKDFLQEGASTGEAQLPPGHPPLGKQAPAQPPLPAGHPPTAAASRPAGAIQYDVPAGWEARPVRGSMRQAQYVLSRAEGDPADGNMVLFFFGPGGGGGVQANLKRWRGMFSTADGGPVGDDAVRQEFLEVNGLKVTILEVSGRYDPRTMAGVGGPSPVKSDYRMLAAIVEGPGGPWFFKGVGPDATMASHRQEFMQMLRSLRR